MEYSNFLSYPVGVDDVSDDAYIRASSELKRGLREVLEVVVLGVMKERPEATVLFISNQLELQLEKRVNFQNNYQHKISQEISVDAGGLQLLEIDEDCDEMRRRDKIQNFLETSNITACSCREYNALLKFSTSEKKDCKKREEKFIDESTDALPSQPPAAAPIEEKTQCVGKVKEDEPSKMEMLMSKTLKQLEQIQARIDETDARLNDLQNTVKKHFARAPEKLNEALPQKEVVILTTNESKSSCSCSSMDEKDVFKTKKVSATAKALASVAPSSSPPPPPPSPAATSAIMTPRPLSRYEKLS